MLLTDPVALAQKLEDLEVGMNEDLVERQVEIKTAIIALIARRHHFQVGPPGTAKSLLVRRLMRRIGGLPEDALFQYLMTKYTTPEEIFGPPSLMALEQDIYRRNLDHKLAVSTFAFLDEIFKGNSSILNALLTIMNERLFFNGGAANEVPLQCIFAASNEMPHGEELNAMWDRLHFRHEIRPVQDKGNFTKMLMSLRAEHPEPNITWEELQACQEFVNRVELPQDIYDTLAILRDNLRKNTGVEPTERRFVDCLPIIRATAFVNGRMTADIDDMRLLRHVLWYRVEDQKVVSQEVLQLSNPIDKEATDLLDNVEALNSQLNEAIRDADNPKGLARTAVEIHAKLQKAKGEFKELKARAELSGRKSEVLDSLNDRIVSTGKVLLTECFGVVEPPKADA